MITYRVGDVVKIYYGCDGEYHEVNYSDQKFNHIAEYNHYNGWANDLSLVRKIVKEQLNTEPEQSELDKKFKGIIDRKFYKKT